MFVAATHGTGILDVSRVFVSISLLLLLTQPLASLFQAIPSLVGAVACCHRIQVFLTAVPRKDYRIRSKESDEREALKKPIEGNQEAMRLEKLGEVTTVISTNAADGDATLRVQNGYFGWTEGNTQVLKDISFSVTKGSLTIIIGPVACGKSTLLKAIIGEVPQVQGSVFISTPTCSFCDQTVWIQNGTIQKNIIGFSNFESQWYSAVIHASALTEDLETLPNGDQTLVGSKGITLSGGQKQRLVGNHFNLDSYVLLRRLLLR
jgi:ATP-binding cassette subfamily C (CFTR/MRP) protein 1